MKELFYKLFWRLLPENKIKAEAGSRILILPTSGIPMQTAMVHLANIKLIEQQGIDYMMPTVVADEKKVMVAALLTKDPLALAYNLLPRDYYIINK